MTRFSTWPSALTRTTRARPGSERDELDMPDRAFGLRREDQPGGLRQAGQHGAGLGQRVLQAAARGSERRGNRLPLVLRQLAEVQQAIDEQAQPLIGRQPSGRGVRREQQAGIGQVRHDIADRGGRQVHRQAARQGPAADRLAGLHVLFNDLAQHGSRTGVEARRQGACGRGCRAVAGLVHGGSNDKLGTRTPWSMPHGGFQTCQILHCGTNYRKAHDARRYGNET